MLNSYGMGFLFTARDLASGTMAGLERRFTSLDDRVTGGSTRMTKAFHEVGLGLGMMTAGAVTVGGAFALANVAGQFEQSIAAVGAVSGASSRELEQLRNAAIDAGIATQFSPTEASLGLRDLSQAGFNARESISLLGPVLDLAAGSLGELSPQAAAGLAAQSMKAFGLNADQASISVDRMLRSVNVFALSAGELPLALGTASRGAQTLKQSLSETLISLGLVKNVIPSVERASTAVAVSMERMADPDVQRRLRGVGAAVTDNQGRFRQFLDIVGDLAGGMDRMNESQRSAFLQETFGREAMGGLNAILTQVTDGIRTNTGETLKGADAVNYLREQFENAGGTAAMFREKMLNTFAGQGQLLRGSLETLAIVIGEPFAAVLKPAVTAVVDALNGLIRMFRGMPAGVKRAFAAFVVVSGALVGLVGTLIAAKGGLSLLGIGLSALGLSAGSLVATILPALGVIGVLAAVIAGFAVAYRENLGGIGDVTRRLWARVQLFFGALKQVFDEGGFSGAVREELNKAENLGLKRFIISLYQITHRIGQIWDGLKQAFVRGIEAMRPVFAELSLGLSDLNRDLEAIFDVVTGGAAGLSTDLFRAFGGTFGKIIASLFSDLVRLFANFAQFSAGLAAGFRSMLKIILPALSAVGRAIDAVIAAWRMLVGNSDASSGKMKESIELWRGLGEVIGKVAGGIFSLVGFALSAWITTIAQLIRVTAFLKAVFVSAFNAYVEYFKPIVHALAGELPKFMAKAWSELKVKMEPFLEFLREFWRELKLVGEWAGNSLSALGRFLPSFVLEPIKSVFGPLFSDSPSPSSEAMPRATSSETGANPAQTEVTIFRRKSFLDDEPARQTLWRPQLPVFTVNVQVDGETVARAVNNAEQSNAARGFSPVPVY